MSSVRFEIAQELIERDEVIDGNARELFGHGKPFGSRWSLEAGSRNLRPIKTLARKVDLIARNEDNQHELCTRFLRLYTSRSPGESNPEFAAIFNGLTGVSVRARNTGSVEGFIEITHAPEQNEPILPTTADLGRMIMVDELLYTQDIRGCSMQVMSDMAATYVLTLCA